MESIELAEHASRIGVQAISSLPPLGPYSFEEVRAYYEAIASASEVPVIVYYYPAISPGARTLEEIKLLLGIPGVIGVKYTEIDLHGWISAINKTFGWNFVRFPNAFSHVGCMINPIGKSRPHR